MFYYLILPLILAGMSLSAASYELNLLETFPQQNILEMLTVKGEALQIKADADSELNLDILLTGPEVELCLRTVQGKEWHYSLRSIHMHVLNQDHSGSRSVLLDLESTLSTSSTGQPNPFHLLMDATYNADLTDSALEIDFSQGKQHIHMNLDSKNDKTNASWKVQSGLGKGALIDLLIFTLKEVGESAKDVIPENRSEKLVKDICSQIGVFLDLLSPLQEWEGVNVNIDGESTYQNSSELFEIFFKNDFYLSSHQPDWNTFMGICSHYSSGPEVPYEWSQEIIIKNPANDIERIADWIQNNAIKQLAEYLNMPSLAYYESYFPFYFNQGLKTLLRNLGEHRPNGTFVFVLSGGENGSVVIQGYNLLQLGQLLIDSIK